MEITDNSFLRQFETETNDGLAKIEYAQQERKIFLTKLILPKNIDDATFKEEFIKKFFPSLKIAMWCDANKP